MSEYFIILDILSSTIKGKNLNDNFNKYTNNLVENINLAKIKDICYGCLRNYYKIENILNCLVTKNIENKKIKYLLFIAIYEINNTKKPIYAIVNDIVNLSFNLTKNIKLKNFVNAVIRNYLRSKPEIENKLSNNLQINYDLPKWFINKIIRDYKSDSSQVLLNLNKEPKISLRLNNKKITLEYYLAKLKQANIEFELFENKICLTNSLSIDKIPLFKEGYISIQDISAQKLSELITIPDNSLVLDACSAPGGKTCQILENYSCSLLALDIDENRLAKVKQNLNRLELKALVKTGDATKLDWWNGQQFDFIISDVPCSATGTIKRNPDIKLHRKLSDIKNFVNLQRKIICNLWQTLKINGTLVYITCSIFKEENQENTKYFAAKLDNLSIGKEISILPNQFRDGFYYCILNKTA